MIKALEAPKLTHDNNPVEVVKQIQGVDLLFTFNGPGWADIGACPAVRAEIRVDSGSILSVRDRLEGADRQAIAAIGTFFGYPVSHDQSFSGFKDSRGLGFKGNDIRNLAWLLEPSTPWTL